MGVPISWKSQAQRSMTLLSSEAEFVALSKATKEIKFIIQCEDIHLAGSQQCHEPTGGIKSTKSMQGHSIRPVHKVMFSQSGPTMIRPNLNNFLA